MLSTLQFDNCATVLLSLFDCVPWCPCISLAGAWDAICAPARVARKEYEGCVFQCTIRQLDNASLHSVQTVCYTIEFGNQIRLSLLEAVARLKRTSHEQPRL